MATDTELAVRNEWQAQLADLDKRLSSARSEVDRWQAEVDLLARQHSELVALLRRLQEAPS